MSAHLLLSGFEPFDGERLNPSWECLRALEETQGQDVRVSCVELAVDRERGPQALLAQVDALSPDAVIMLGEAGGRMAVTPERVAINVDDYRIPDHGQRQPRDEAIVPGGPAAYFSTLPLRDMVIALHARRIPAEVSNSAGTYLCNHLFYRMMHELERRGSRIPAGFIHLPYVTEQVLGVRPARPSLPLPTLVEAVRICIEICARAASPRA